MTVCSVPDCERKVLAKTMCAAHYQRSRTGQPLDAPLRSYTRGGTCSVDGCVQPLDGHGLCSRHRQRQARGVPLDGDNRRRLERGCSVDGCERDHAANGLCQSHWRRNKKGQDISAPIVPKLITDDLLARLRTYAPTGAPDECWEWTRALNKGYGAMSVPGSRMRQAHVIAWELHHEIELPDGLVVRHACDNPPCTNPAHLILGTHEDNSHDRLARGADAYNGTGFRHRTQAEVTSMRALHTAGMNMTEISRQFQCSRTTAMRIVKGISFQGI
ncbi:HNH endonuclease signature motif containing protein [Mycolicibacterium fluoranthenivorans]|uniref:HNH endonuclease signature motif containing protein n=2 Tax=Mycolicibacterium fluoranthenivorans TaxID=258505 RepID=UPI0039089289